MEAVVGLFLMMFGVCHGVESYCDGRPDGAHCYGTLGGTLDIKLTDSTSEIIRFQLLKNTSLILNGRSNSSKHNTTDERFLFYLSNGTLRIHNLSSTDSGKYTFSTFKFDGKISAERTFQIFIQEGGILPVICGVLSALVILLVVGVAAICFEKRKNKTKQKEEDDQEVTYADVRVRQQQQKPVKGREEEVEYGQVKLLQ
ncbi:unnamed protein product [Oreochromis niloticus]|nr:unnamed protein product [Mustela putorius furo]